ncbi:hypothetical protein, partial [Bacteroides heparinolyticus]|uniref:hypothetical protein n=1 Tax=Prevotella heparinolytica TaxID=28113 RepID=UPI0035A1755D
MLGPLIICILITHFFYTFVSQLNPQRRCEWVRRRRFYDVFRHVTARLCGAKVEKRNEIRRKNKE